MKISPKIFIKLTVTTVLMVFAYKAVDISVIKSTIGRIDLMLVVVSLLIKSFCLVLQASRWQLILKELEIIIPFSAAWKNVLVGFFFNQTLPSSVGGDAVRAWKFRQLGVKKVVVSIILDRMAGLFALFLSSLVCTLILTKTEIAAPTDASLQYVLLINFLGILLISIIPMTDKIFNFIGFSWISNKLEIRLLAETIRKLVSKPIRFLMVTTSSISMHLLLAVSGYILLLSIGSSPNFWLFFPYFLLALTISTIPLSIGGWGVRETAMISVFYFINIEAEVALVFSILYGLLMICVGIPGGILWLFKTKLN